MLSTNPTAGAPTKSSEERSSELPAFYKNTQEERLNALASFSGITEEDKKALSHPSSLAFSQANRMIENVVGIFPLPMAYATNFKVNGKDYLVPMVIEEASVVAAASNAAKLARASGGFQAQSGEQLMIGQIQIVEVQDIEGSIARINAAHDKLVDLANTVFPSMKHFGGGAKSLVVRELKTKRGPMLIVHLVVDVKDAMGANSVNSMAEGIATTLEELSGGKVRLRILSNLAYLRVFRSRAVWKKEVLASSTGLSSGIVVDAILDGWAFAEADQFRATTHNKGIMNGVSAVCVATGNDWRAIEAGSHSYACFKRNYTSLTQYHKDANGDLVGEIELPLALGIIGGMTTIHPIAKINLKILGVKSSQQFGEVVASVGLAQNFAALRALATEGIQRGHMKLHAKNIAVMAGAEGEQVDQLAKLLAKSGHVDVLKAKELLKTLPAKTPSTATTSPSSSTSTTKTNAPKSKL